MRVDRVKRFVWLERIVMHHWQNRVLNNPGHVRSEPLAFVFRLPTALIGH